MTKKKLKDSEVYDKAFVLASGNYLTERLPEDYADMDDDLFEEFIGQNIWEGVENLPIKEVISQIAQTADLLVRFRNMDLS